VASGLISGFLASCERFPHRVALEVDGRAVTYEQLRSVAAGIAEALRTEVASDGSSLTAIFGHKSTAAFAGVLGALMHGHGYVPLNPGFPPERTAMMLNRSECAAIVVDTSALPLLPAVLAAAERPVVVIAPESGLELDAGLVRAGHRVVRASDVRNLAAEADRPDPESIAYLLFTSGSTGQPKGVMVANRNVAHFLSYMADLYGIDESDRLSHTFDLTFDLAVFDLFIAWERGATVCCPTPQELRRPDRYIGGRRLSVWFSVPSLAIYMNGLGMLKQNAFPSLRLSLFCGEALPLEIAAAWAAAAPAAELENLYGPTELTIACTRYRYDEGATSGEAERGIVPIGTPFPGMEAQVVDDELQAVHGDAHGELLMSGPQMTLGYWRDEERTNAAFVVPPGQTRRFYRTGDRVRRRDDDGPLLYLGRVDHQIKVRGFRVELGEIEAVIRDATGLNGVVAVGWPQTASGATAVEAFVEGELDDVDGVRSALKARLPEYMVPRRIHSMERLPLNSNGKYDRSALVAALEGAL
jgi:amino acid adenylation domain-containing protein